MDYSTWQQLVNGPAALRRQEELRHERRLPSPSQAEIVADIGRTSTALSLGAAGSLYALGRLVDDLARLRRHTRERAAEEGAQRGHEAPRHPGDRPRASWVMGRSARWHDPDVLAELRMHELAEQRQAFTMLQAGAVGSPAMAWVAVRTVARLFRRRRRR